MREEVYRVKRPGYIVFGNPDYYGKQEYKGNIKSYSPANSFDTRVILYESGPQKKAMRSMSVCFIHRALNTEIRESKCTLKIRRHTELLPHGEKILIEIDGKWGRNQRGSLRMVWRNPEIFPLNKTKNNLRGCDFNDQTTKEHGLSGYEKDG